MAIRLPAIINAKKILRRSSSCGKEATSMSLNVPKGHVAVYVGEEQKKRFVVPISYLNEPAFQELLNKAEEEFGFDHPIGGLTIPSVCKPNVLEFHKSMRMMSSSGCTALARDCYASFAARLQGSGTKDNQLLCLLRRRCIMIILT